MHKHLEKLHSLMPGKVSALTYDEAINRANYAAEFVTHPYWDVMSGMLSGTIKSETEQLLSTDEHMAVNRASVAICRKVLQMPYFDIEQGRMAEDVYQRSKARRGAGRSGDVRRGAMNV